MHYTGKKESKKEKEKKGHKKFALREFVPEPSEYVRSKTGLLYPQDHLSKELRICCLKEVHIPSPYGD